LRVEMITNSMVMKGLHAEAKGQKQPQSLAASTACSIATRTRTVLVSDSSCIAHRVTVGQAGAFIWQLVGVLEM
jgi:hypothetical protein